MEEACGISQGGPPAPSFFLNLSAVLPGMWIFVLPPGMEPTPSVLAEGILATGPPGESLHLHFYPSENHCSCCGLDYW